MVDMVDMNEGLELMVEKLEKIVAEESREFQSVQTFGGALRVDVNKVFVGREDGLRALEQLRRFSLREAS